MDSVEPLNVQSAPETNKMLCVFLSFSKIGVDTLDNIHSVLTAYRGDDEVYIKNTDTGAVSKINTKVNACEMLKGELFGVNGVSDVGIFNKK